MWKKPFLMTLLALVLAHTASAQVRVVGNVRDKTMIDLSGLAAASSGPAAEFKRTLENDLIRSGWFTPARGGADVAVSGTVSGGGNLSVDCRVVNRRTSQSYLEKRYSAGASEARYLAHQVADEIVSAVKGRKGMASARLALVGTRSGHKELYLCDADGGNMIQLTSDRSVSVHPEWAPDGKTLTYTSYIRQFPDVYEINVETGRRNQIASFPGLNTGAAISPNGQDVAIILSKDGNPELYVMDRRSKRTTRLTRTLNGAEASPAWSPDGNEIVYVSDVSGRPQLYVISRSGGHPKRITSRGSENVAPHWGSNNLITYSSRIGGNYHICIVDPATLQVKQVSTGGADYEEPCWAPDGRHIFSTRSVNYRSKVYVLDSLGDPPVSLTDHQGDWYSPTCSMN